MASNQETVIGADVILVGELTFHKSVRIVGKFEGTIKGTGRIHIDESAYCKADITAAVVVVDGSVHGNVTATEHVRLNPKAKVTGDVAGPNVSLADGASVVGRCKIGQINRTAGRNRRNRRPSTNRVGKGRSNGRSPASTAPATPGAPIASLTSLSAPREQALQPASDQRWPQTR
jgi:cytoskeletal protein CcmA (bactofilin family)